MVSAAPTRAAPARASFQVQAHADRMHRLFSDRGTDELSAVLLGELYRTRYEEFETLLARWESTLRRRADEAVTTLAAVKGVKGLLLVGGVGRGEAWPLSDIDLVPIYDDAKEARARKAVARRSEYLLRRWANEGGWRARPLDFQPCRGVVLAARHHTPQARDEAPNTQAG